MSLHKKPIKGSALVKLRNAVSSSDGATVTITETWTGDYATLKTKQLSLIMEVKGTTLTPTEAAQGELKITTEIPLTSENGKRPPSVQTVEVLWVELRKPVQEHPAFAEMTADEKKEVIRQAADEAVTISEVSTSGIDLYELLAAGTTEYAVGVPVVRRTTTNVQGNIGSGNAWVRGNPPVEVSGSWEWMKTADERRQVGRRFDKVEEWTGANEWNEILYPATP
jgi:hypothetical protein